MNDLLRLERERRGLPDYDRPPPPEPKPERPKPQRMVRCSKCDESFTADSFKAAGSANKRSKVCDACWLERYPARYVPCSVCRTRIKTRGKSDDPTCRPCQRAEPRPSHCLDCGVSVTGRRMTLGRCQPCYMKAWRERRGINSRGRVGAWTHEPARAA